MKLSKIFTFLFLLSFVLMLSTGNLIAEDQVEISGTLTDTIRELFNQYFLTVAVFAAAVTGLTSFVTKFLIGLPGFAKQLISMLIGVLAALFGYFFNLGIFEEVTLIGAIITGLNVGMGANSIYDLLKGFVKLKRSKN